MTYLLEFEFVQPGLESSPTTYYSTIRTGGHNVT